MIFNYHMRLGYCKIPINQLVILFLNTEIDCKNLFLLRYNIAKFLMETMLFKLSKPNIWCCSILFCLFFDDTPVYP